MEIDLTGRCALITGGSKGLGLAMARRFSMSGASVTIVARRPAELAEAVADLKTTAKAVMAGVAADVSTAEGTALAFQGAEGAMGKVDILVNNAGTAQAGPFETLTDEYWQGDLDLKLFAAIRLARLALPGMKKRRWGRIINSLNSGARTPGPGSAPTSVTRAAGLALTKVLAGECAPYNVLVNALLVGRFKTEQSSRGAMRLSGDLEEGFAKMAKAIPLGRVGEPEEYANLACFLVSDAGSYITGAGINADGGMAPAP